MTMSDKALSTDSQRDLAGRMVYIVDDDDIFRSYLAINLRSAKLNVTEFADGASLMSCLEERTPDCILLDYNLASENGLYLHEQLKIRFPQLPPVVMVSADEGQRTVIKAFRVGIDDFIPKRNLRPDDVIDAVRRAIVKYDGEHARDVEIARLRESSLADGLTGLNSRKELERKLSMLANPAVRRRFGLISLSLPQYTAVSSRFGIAAADRLLRAFGMRLKAQVRREDFCGRYDRETFFYVIDANVSRLAVRELCERLNRELAFSENIESARIDLSAIVDGILFPDDVDTLEHVMAHLGSELDRHQVAALQFATSADKWMTIATSDVPAADGAARIGERRRSVRVRCLKQGAIIFNDMSSTIDCTIRNVSDHGARLRVSGVFAIPEYFRLRVGEAGVVRQVRMRWHVNDELGVEFVEN